MLALHIFKEETLSVRKARICIIFREHELAKLR